MDSKNSEAETVAGAAEDMDINTALSRKVHLDQEQVDMVEVVHEVALKTEVATNQKPSTATVEAAALQADSVTGNLKAVKHLAAMATLLQTVTHASTKLALRYNSTDNI